MTKLLLASLLAVTGFAGLAAASPASAASSPVGVTVPYCDTTTNISDNADTIKMQLRGDGYNAQSVEEWNGCVRAWVADANGTQHSAYFDPDTLRLLASSEPTRG